MKKTLFVFAAITFLVFGLSVIQDVNKSNQELHVKQIELRNNEVKLKKLEADFNHLNGTNAENEQQIQELEQKRQQLEKEKSDLEAQLQAKARLKASQSKAYAAAVPTVPYTQRAPASTGNCGDNVYKQYIYQHESGCRTDALNSIGCYGIGQSCPASKIAHCGADFTCQDTWFSNYAVSRYGSWEKAYYFWLANHWW